MTRRILVVITADCGCLPLQSFYVEVCRRYTVLEGASNGASDGPEAPFRMLARTQASRFSEATRRIGNNKRASVREPRDHDPRLGHEISVAMPRTILSRSEERRVGK